VSARTLAVDVLLGLGVAAQLVCCLGVLVMRDTLDRLHYAAGGSTVGPILIAAAVLVEHPHDSSGITAIVTAGFLLLASPVVTVATARAVRARRGEP
jgi:monovalent cation/proton antiporter MnhG/PhaG subunit